jgi:hypothetical protein
MLARYFSSNYSNQHFENPGEPPPLRCGGQWRRIFGVSLKHRYQRAISYWLLKGLIKRVGNVPG